MFLVTPDLCPNNKPSKVHRNSCWIAWLVAIVTATLAICTGCAGMSLVRSQSSGPITVSVSPTQATVASGGSLQFVATVTGTSQTSVTWSATGGSVSATGTLKAPSTPSPATLTVIATSTADSSKQAAALVSVAAGPTITTTFLTPATVGTSYNSALEAKGGEPPYEWSVVSGTLPAGIRLTAASGILNGTPTVEGAFPFGVQLTDANANRTLQNLTLLVSSDSTPAECAAPTYQCARTDTAIVPLPLTLPNWGGLTGAGAVFTDATFNVSYPPRYLRITDSTIGGLVFPGDSSQQYTGFAVSAGSGDDAHFDIDDTLFWVYGTQSYLYLFGLTQSPLRTIPVWGSSRYGAPFWSQINRNYLYALQYSLGDGSSLYRLDFTGCTGTASGSYFWDNAGVGGSDTVFAGAIGAQDTDNRVYAYNSATQTCYVYNTRFGSIHSFTVNSGTVTGAITCNGTTAATGTNFDPSGNWQGDSFTINGRGTYQIQNVIDAADLTLGGTCVAGTYSYSIQPGTYIGSASDGEHYSVHNIRMDPQGVWLIVEEGSYCYDTAGDAPTGTNCNVIHAWQVGTSTVNSCIWSGSNDPGACGGHYTETASGWINDDGSFLNRQVSMQFRPWSDMSTTDPSDVTELNTNSVNMNGLLLNDHPSTKNDPLGTHGYPVLSSTYTNEATVGAITAPYSNEIVGWTQTPGPVLRFGHTFNSALEDPGSQFSSWIAIGAPSATGRFYLFTTDGEGTLGNTDGSSNCEVLSYNCRSDLFLLDLAPPALVAPPSGAVVATH
jgi:hypothetical protein